MKPFIFLALASLSILVASMARAQTDETLFIAPQYYEVSGVAAGDVLNIRAEPDPHSAIVGTLAPGAGPVEIIATTQTATPWGKVIAGDGSGWVSMSYLAQIDPESVPGTPLPTSTVCTGTEPFWSLTFTDKTMSFEAPDVSPIALPLVGSGSFVARPHRFYAIADSGPARLTAVISSGEYCSDGMSDRDYGWSVDLLQSDGGTVSGYSGCCTRAVDK
ncbi:MAG: SH3 domain-containing protein [Rhodobiaceae bacterium]|nr:SH3 domain-containing protein [Rhodobiaceae bacterium]MCC0056529.1 SH3 domain-containing protein [Rhodobiaceae bacterium]